MPETLFFVCGKGHIFRSLASMKNGRVRQCSECAGITPDRRGRASMEQARILASRTPHGRSFIQVFTAGQMRRTKRKATA